MQLRIDANKEGNVNSKRSEKEDLIIESFDGYQKKENV